MKIGERIAQVRGKRSRKSFAEHLGIVENTLRNYEMGLSLPNSDVIAEFCKKENVSSHWLLMGEGPIFTTDEVRKIPARAGNLCAGDSLATYETVPASEKLEAPTHQVVMIPLVEARLSAGHGSFETDGTSERKYSFRSDFLSRKGSIKDMVMMRVDGDSMSPEVKNGDVVLIDQSQTAPRAGKIYAVGVEDLVFLKRVHAEPGKLLLMSDNTAYAPLEIDTRGDLENCVRIIGRAIWWCRED